MNKYKVVLYKTSRRWRVYKDNGIFDFETLNDMSLEVYSQAMELIRMGHFEVVDD